MATYLNFSRLFRVQVITLSALPPSEQDQGLNLLCPVRALRIHIERSAPFRQLETALCMLWRPHQRVSGHKAETIQMAGLADHICQVL